MRVLEKSTPAVRSLAAQTRRQLMYLAIVIFFGLIALVVTFSFYQVSQASKGYMRSEALVLERAMEQDPDYVLPQKNEFSAYRTWDEIPPEIRSLFSEHHIQPSKPVEILRWNSQGVREYGALVYSHERQSGGVYLVEFESADKIDALISDLFRQTLIEAGLITGLFMLGLFMMISWLFNKAQEPLYLLVAWSDHVKQDPDAGIETQFSISELNEIAQHLLSTLDQLKSSNEREQQFLRHASHELRTPLAIIQASLDTLSVRTATDNPGHAALERARRASANIVLLSEALLWLARQSSRPATRSRVEPRVMCESLMAEMRYLIEHKRIDVEIQSQVAAIEIEADLFRIVLANLIRNAFQHSVEGEIKLSVTATSLMIVNPLAVDSVPDDVCFGLGLQLVERIADKLGWTFSFSLQCDKAQAVLAWSVKP